MPLYQMILTQLATILVVCLIHGIFLRKFLSIKKQVKLLEQINRNLMELNHSGEQEKYAPPRTSTQRSAAPINVQPETRSNIYAPKRTETNPKTNPEPSRRQTPSIGILSSRNTRDF